MITLKPRGLDGIKQAITKMPKKVRGVATREAALYLLGNERRGLLHYPPQRTIHPERKMYKRTYNLRFGWQVSSWDDGTKIKIVNSVDYAPYPYSRFAGRPWMWRTIKDIIAANTAGAIKAAEREVQKEIKAQGF